MSTNRNYGPNSYGTVIDKKNRVFAAYCARVRKNDKNLNTNITQFCKEAVVNRNFFYDTFGSMENIPAVAQTELEKIIEHAIASEDLTIPYVVILSLLKSIEANANIAYIVTNVTAVREKFGLFIMKYLCEYIYKRAWDSPLQRNEEEIQKMGHLYLMAKIDELADVVVRKEYSPLSLEDEANLISETMRRPLSKLTGKGD